MVIRVANIVDTSVECAHTRTIRFEDHSTAEPGQFVMVWIPGVDEIPMSLSYIGDVKGVTVHDVGKASSALSQMRQGDTIGLRGPMGKGYEIQGQSILFVAGGTGAASLMPAIEAAREKKIESTVVIGAKTASELIFVDRAKTLSTDVRISTDDGSREYKGLASELAKEILRDSDYEGVLTCGPEKMMKSVALECIKNSIPVQVSLERFMRCGMGICDSCSFGGLHVCVDGPVFDGGEVVRVKDFGVFRRSADGRREKIA